MTKRRPRAAVFVCAFGREGRRDARAERADKKKRAFPKEGPDEVARLAGFEPTTPWFVAKYSIQLSYSRTQKRDYSRVI